MLSSRASKSPSSSHGLCGVVLAALAILNHLTKTTNVAQYLFLTVNRLINLRVTQSRSKFLYSSFLFSVCFYRLVIIVTTFLRKTLNLVSIIFSMLWLVHGFCVGWKGVWFHMCLFYRGQELLSGVSISLSVTCQHQLDNFFFFFFFVAVCSIALEDKLLQC